jgi:RNA polymerase sigma-70 factor, ECF subfamily
MEKRTIQAARGGDRQAFARLYRANVKPIFRYIYYRVSDKQLTEDLTSDVFMRALKAIERYEDTGRPFIAWLYRIAHARVVDHYRKRDSRPSPAQLDEIASYKDMDQRLLQRQTAQALRQAIAELTPAQQQVVVLRFIEGRSILEVADIMDKKPNAIKQLQHRALNTLASRLQRSGFPIEDVLKGLSS